MFRRRKSISVLLAIVLLLSCLPVAYAKTEPLFDVWVPTNTHKMMLDEPFPANADQVMKLEAARNEFESGQVIIKAGNEPLSKLQVSISDLKLQGGPAKIGKEHIELFRQHYIEVTTSTTTAYPKGWYPDALIPLDGKLEVAAGQNQGIWVKVYVPKGTPAGIYTGEIQLHETGNPVRIPVELTVWDFELTDESHSKTAFGVWGGPVQEAHGNVQGEEAWRYIEKYYWASVEQRLTPGYLPIPDRDIDDYVERASRFINDPRISAYRLPYYKDAQGEPDTQKIKELIDKLRERGLLDKGYFYISEIDEPVPHPNASNNYDRVKVINDALKQAAPDVPHLVTIQPLDELLGEVDIWSPEIDKYDYDFARERQAAGEEIWWYTSVFPKHPFPSYHLDDDLVGARLLPWVQHDYGVEGTLYWATTQFQKYDAAQKKYVSRDVWTDPLAFPGANGDGYLFYPGTELGIDGPIGTIRLEVLRESMEDYEYLWHYEQRLHEIAAKLGIEDTFSYRDAIRPFYDRLYENIKTFEENPELVMQVRREIAREIAAPETIPVLVAVESTTVGSRTVTVYAAQDSQVTLNGTPMPLTKQETGHDQFSQTLALEPGLHNIDIVVTQDGVTKQVHRELAVYEFDTPYTIPLNDVETEEAVKRFTSSTVSLSLSDEYVTEGNHSMKAVFPADVNFPNFRLLEAGKGFRSADWSSFDALEFDVFNPGGTTQFYVKFHQLNGKTDDAFIQTVRSNHGKTVRIPLSKVDLDITQMKGIEIWVWRHTLPQTLYFDNFRFVSTQPGESMAP
ncbi:DUF4091 domain-containing protein [Paenibacillus sp. J2TS4]|uniref:DUF4091 domain-containing protein n=1 Tax=Paenibacillus sp. J2TS4 TaxID=2807194 RepID=UPI001B28C15E|nr:DUF4091 domain-containing protein [Paenibacillus sp. J2TS4]GIP35380.1 hypothetical protein J2TS4_45900 [Paenibacillus sp. J2TS4]